MDQIDAVCCNPSTVEDEPFAMSNSPQTLIDSFREHVAKRPDARFMTQPMGNGECRHWTYAEAMDETRRMAAHLAGLRLEPGSRIALCSKNCAWWVLADLAIWMAGHVTVPVYPTLTGENVAYILEHSDSRLLFVGKLDEHPWNEMKGGVPKDLPTVSFPLSPAHDHDGGQHERWNDLVQKTEPIQSPVERAPEEMATIIYTSG